MWPCNTHPACTLFFTAPALGPSFTCMYTITSNSAFTTHRLCSILIDRPLPGWQPLTGPEQVVACAQAPPCYSPPVPCSPCVLHSLESLCQVGGLRPASGHQIVVHALVVREHGGGGPDLCAHIADGGHAGARQRLHTWAKVLNNGASATLHRQDAGDLCMHVHPACESITNNIRLLGSCTSFISE